MRLTNKQRFDAGVQAASLYERLQSGSDSRTSVGELRDVTVEAQRALALWKRAFAGNEEVFRGRLAWDGLDEELVLSRLSRSTSRGEPAAWTEWLNRFLEESSALARTLKNDKPVVELERFGSAESPPFMELWIPIVRAARQVLLEVARDASEEVLPSALVSLEDKLLWDVARTGELASYERFCARPEAVSYSGFVADMLSHELAGFFLDYPVLARQLALLAATWVEWQAELFSRVRADRAIIAREFLRGGDPGRLDQIGGLSDRHDGGRRVVLLRFESGLRLIYKPREIGLERAFHEFVSWTRSRGLQSAPRALKVVERPGYGWVECVNHEALSDPREVAQYYRRAGSLVCLAFALRGKDLHMENVIATRSGPVIVDAETFFQPELASDDDADGESGAEASCLSTGMLTLLETDRRGAAYDVGGLRGRGGFLAPRKKRKWEALGSDGLHFVEADWFAPPSRNRVFVGEEEQRPDDHAQELIEGFSEAYRFLQQRRTEILASGGPLSWFAKRRVRVLLRPTRQYGLLLHTLAAPSYQRSGLQRGLAVEAMQRAHDRRIARPRFWPLVADERSAVEALDIPCFTVDSTETCIVSRGGERVDGYISVSGMSMVSKRLSNLDDEDLSWQIDWLRFGLSSSLDSRLETPLEPSSATTAAAAGATPDSGLMAGSLWVGHELLARGQRDKNGSLTWPCPDPRARQKGSAPNTDLYDGALGIAIYFAALASASGDMAWSDEARAVIGPLAQLLRDGDPESAVPDESVGIGDGVGSLVYALCTLGRLLQDDSYLELAERVATVIGEDRIRSDLSLDLMSGSAGALLALLALHEEFGVPWALGAAVVCGQHLISKQVPCQRGGAAWPQNGGRLMTGWAHGASGIAYALCRLFAATDDRRFLDAASAGYLYERELFSASHRNWPIVGRDGEPEQFLVAWCHGAPGIALGRTLASDVLCDAAVSEEIEAALATTARPDLGRLDHLCCGNLGRSEVLLTIGRRLGREDVIVASETILRKVVARARERGHFALASTRYVYRVFAPGFFRGLSGIGYQLLRAAVPERFPSVLAFETVSPRTDGEEMGGR